MRFGLLGVLVVSVALVGCSKPKRDMTRLDVAGSHPVDLITCVAGLPMATSKYRLIDRNYVCLTEMQARIKAGKYTKDELDDYVAVAKMKIVQYNAAVQREAEDNRLSAALFNQSLNTQIMANAVAASSY